MFGLCIRTLGGRVQIVQRPVQRVRRWTLNLAGEPVEMSELPSHAAPDDDEQCDGRVNVQFAFRHRQAANLKEEGEKKNYK